MDSTAQKIPVILDVDTGYDDALALLLALRAPQLDIRGITCVAGNQRLAQVVTNTRKILDALGASIPLAAGADRPLLEPMRIPLALHGNDGMADLGLPTPTAPVETGHAVEFMRTQILESEEPLTLICLAPLTNIALLLRLYPDVAARIGQIVVMGGTLAASGNTSPLAEFNIRHDPEAAAIVLESGLPVRLYPLDVFRAISFDRDEAQRFAASTAVAAQLAGRILQFSCTYFERSTALVGDAGTVATVIDPTACKVERFPVTVALETGPVRGMTVLDRRPSHQRGQSNDWWSAGTPQIEVIKTVDAQRYRTMMQEIWMDSQV